MMRVSSLVLAAALLCGCGDKETKDRDTSAPEIVAGVAPVAYLARRIAGDRLRVGVLIDQGVDPHLYDPTPRQVVRLARAKCLLTVGLPFEHALATKLSAEAADVTVVDLTEGLDLIEATEHDHDHAHHDNEAEPEMDPHVWMSPRLAAAMARGICKAMSQTDPAHSEAFERNLEALLADLDRLHRQLEQTLAPLRGRTLLVFHPAFGYFAREYGLIQRAVETGGKQPGPRHIKRLVDLARTEDVRVIFVQPQFSRRAAESIATQIGGAVVPVDPLSGDYITNLTQLADTIQRALAAPPSDRQGE